MGWSRLLEAGRIDRHQSSMRELDGIRAAIDRNLRDAALAGLSADNRFGLAYEAALLAAKMAVHCAGYRAKAVPGAHRALFEGLVVALGPDIRERADFFELCRRRRNDLSYEAAGVVTDRQARETLTEAKKLIAAVQGWVTLNHPGLARP